MTPKQLRLFASPPKHTPPRASIVRCPDAPPGRTGLRSFMTVEQIPDETR